jgi:transcription elongation factor Elf1
MIGDKFGIVICSRCNWAKGVSLNSKTTSCTNCGKRIQITSSKILHVVNTQKELAQAVGQVNAQLKKGLDIYLKDLQEFENKNQLIEKSTSNDTTLDDKLQRAKSIGNKEGRIVYIIRTLKENSRELEEKELKRALQGIGIKDVEKQIDSLIAMNMIYQPKKGLYKFV